MIDPQFQAGRFLKTFHKDNKIQMVSIKSSQLLKIIENGARFGLPILIENLEDNIPSVLDSILLR